MADIEKVIKGLKACVVSDYTCGRCPYNYIDEETDCSNALMEDALKMLEEQQNQIAMMKMIYGEGTVVGELVRCKDCKHYNHEKKWCQHIMSANGGNWFCADGERR